MSDKTHYRKVFKSDHLGVADLEDLIEAGKPLIFTIREVKQEYGVSVAGRKGDFNIAYFKEPIKPLVLNATNSKVMKSLCGGSAFVEDWTNTAVQLYIDTNAKLKGEVVGGVRISPDPPTVKKPTVTPGHKAWPSAIAASKRDGNFAKVLEHANLSEAHQKEIIDLVKAEAKAAEPVSAEPVANAG
jgi:hypothetical protein